MRNITNLNFFDDIQIFLPKSIVEISKNGIFFYHDSTSSGGKIYLRSINVRELKYDENGKIIPIYGHN